MFQKFMEDDSIVNYTITFFKIPMWHSERLQYSANLLVMTEKMKNSRDNEKFCAAILTDLLKAFYYACHTFLIAELNAYGFDLNALNTEVYL